MQLYFFMQYILHCVYCHLSFYILSRHLQRVEVYLFVATVSPRIQVFCKSNNRLKIQKQNALVSDLYNALLSIHSLKTLIFHFTKLSILKEKKNKISSIIEVCDKFLKAFTKLMRENQRDFFFIFNYF